MSRAVLNETLASATTKRDAEVLAAREALARSETEARRRDAVLREFRAKLAWQTRVNQESIGSAIELAARVYVGEITASDALDIAKGLAFARQDARELQWLVPPEQWQSLKSLLELNEEAGVALIERAIRRGEFELAQNLARECVETPRGIGRACVALKLASRSTSELAGPATTLIAEALDPDNPVNAYEPVEERAYVVARCALALDGAALESAARSARKLLSESNPNTEIDVNITLAVITALACANDPSSAMALWRAQSVSNDIDALALDDALDAHKAIVASLAPEAIAQWESELAASIDTRNARFDVLALADTLRGSAREKLVAELERSASPDPSPFVVRMPWGTREDALDREISRLAAASPFARSIEFNQLVALNRFDDALVSWLVDRYQRYERDTDAIESALRSAIVRAAQQGFARALAYIPKIRRDRLLSTPRFYDGLPVELVRELLPQCSAGVVYSGASRWIYCLDEAGGRGRCSDTRICNWLHRCCVIRILYRKGI